MRDKLENFVEKHVLEFDVKEPRKEIWSLIENNLDEMTKDTDALEQFVITNKNSFNNDIPNPEIWSKIDKQLSPNKHQQVRKVRILRWASIAASIAFLMLASAAAGIYFYGEKDKGEIVSTNPMSPDVTNDISAELVALEQLYKKRVNRKRVQLVSYNDSQIRNEVLSTVNEDLSKVDEILNELRDEFKNAPKGSEEQIINAMAKNYETKLKILEIVLKRIKSAESNNEDDEGISL